MNSLACMRCLSDQVRQAQLCLLMPALQNTADSTNILIIIVVMFTDRQRQDVIYCGRNLRFSI